MSIRLAQSLDNKVYLHSINYQVSNSISEIKLNLKSQGILDEHCYLFIEVVAGVSPKIPLVDLIMDALERAAQC